LDPTAQPFSSRQTSTSSTPIRASDYLYCLPKQRLERYSVALAKLRHARLREDQECIRVFADDFRPHLFALIKDRPASLNTIDGTPVNPSTDAVIDIRKSPVVPNGKLVVAPASCRLFACSH
jgi:hypothetical protein